MGPFKLMSIANIDWGTWSCHMLLEPSAASCWLVVETYRKKGAALHIPHEVMRGIHDSPNYIYIPMFCKNNIDLLFYIYPNKS